MEVVLLIEIIKAKINSQTGGDNTWMFVASALCSVVGFLAVQLWIQSNKIAGMNASHLILKSKVDCVDDKLNDINTKMDTFLKQEIDILKSLTNRQKR